MKTGVVCIVGEFIFDKDTLIEEALFSQEQALLYVQGVYTNPLCKKHGITPQKLHENEIADKILAQEKMQQIMRSNNMYVTKHDIAQSVNKEILLMQAMNTLNEFDAVLNKLAKKMRDWYGLYNPEFEKSITNNDAFVKIITQKSKDELLKELNINQSMGGSLDKTDKDMLLDTAQDITKMYERREKIIQYIQEIAQTLIPNTVAITGGIMAARMLTTAGSVEKLSKFPSSTIQLLGAENALFKHIRTGSRCPKYGFLINHPLVTKAQKRIKGKVARAIADKIAIAVKVDYFKGDPIGEAMREKLEKRFGSW